MNAQNLRQQLSTLTAQSGGHKEQADRFRSLLEQILSSDDVTNLLKIFIEASKFIYSNIDVKNSRAILISL